MKRAINIISITIMLLIAGNAIGQINGYEYCTPITINNLAYKAVLIDDFSFIIPLQNDAFKCEKYGGHVKNIDGSDICFALGNKPSEAINHILLNYDPKTGTVFAMIRVKDLNTSYTDLLVFYGAENPEFTSKPLKDVLTSKHIAALPFDNCDPTFSQCEIHASGHLGEGLLKNAMHIDAAASEYMYTVLKDAKTLTSHNINFWLKYENTSKKTWDNFQIASIADDFQSIDFYLVRNENSDSFFLKAIIGDGAETQEITSSNKTTIEPKKWYNVAYTYDAEINKIMFFVNGEQLGFSEEVNASINMKTPGLFLGNANATAPVELCYDNVFVLNEAIHGEYLEAICNNIIECMNPGTRIVMQNEMLTQELRILSPIDLLYFDCECNGNGSVQVKWITGSEYSIDYYLVERSQDKEYFEMAGMVNGNGTNEEIKEYAFVDDYAYDGKNFYHLMPTTTTGTYIVTDVVVANCSMDIPVEPSIYLFPNPFAENLELTIFNLPENNLNIKIIDSNGSTVKDFAYDDIEAGSTHKVLKLRECDASEYYINIQSGEFIQTKKVKKI